MAFQRKQTCAAGSASRPPRSPRTAERLAMAHAIVITPFLLIGPPDRGDIHRGKLALLLPPSLSPSPGARAAWNLAG